MIHCSVTKELIKFQNCFSSKRRPNLQNAFYQTYGDSCDGRICICVSFTKPVMPPLSTLIHSLKLRRI